MKPPSPPTPAMIRQAADWAAEFDAGDLSSETRRAHEHWCDADPRQRPVFDSMRRFDASFERLEAVEKGALDRALRMPARRRRRAGGAVFAIALLLAGGIGARRSFLVRSYLADVQTPIGTQRSLVMADGSHVVVDTDSSIDLVDNQVARGVTLFRGQMQVEVAPDRRRPFVVETRNGTATALGTAYTVRLTDQAMIVTVLHSRVRVCPAGDRDDAACRTLSAGQSAAATLHAVTRLADVNIEQASAWSKGWLEADDRPLLEVLAEFNRYRPDPVRFDPAELRDLRVTGSYPLTGGDRAIRAVAERGGLRLSRARDGALVLER